MRRGAIFAFGPIALLAASASSTARAGDREACEAAFEQAQTLRDARKLIAARDQLRVCARAECPARMAQDCTSWVAEIDPRIPSVVVVATDGSGAALPEGVAVSVDHGVARNVDGTAWDMDPGPHTFTWAAADGTKVEKPFLVLEGQKDQRVAVALTPAHTARAAPSSAAVVSSGGALETAGHSRRVLAVVVGGVGLAGVALGAVFGGLTFSAASAVNNDCPNHRDCSSQTLRDHANAVTFGTVSDVGFIAGGVLVATGLTLYFTAPNGPSPTVGLDVEPAGFRLTGRF